MLDSAARTWAWVLGAALGLTGPLAAEFGGRAILSWRSYDTEGLATEGLHQLYELRLERDLTDALRFELRFRGEDDASGSTVLDERRTSDFRRGEPGARLSFTKGSLRLVGDWNRNIVQTSDDSGDDSELTREYGRARLSWQRERFPGLTIDAERQRLEDPTQALDLTETRQSALVGYSLGGLALSGSETVRELEDLGTGFRRRSDDLQGTLAFSGSYWRDRLSLGVAAAAGEGRVEESALEPSALVPNPVVIAATFQTHDPTPGDDRDAPLVENAALRDGDLGNPAGVPLGPEAPVDLNLAVDLGRFTEVDELRIVARDSRGEPVATGGPVVWDLWSSDDFVIWRRETTGVASRFDAGQGFWSVTFPRSTRRYLKVVTFFVNSVATEVTELQAFFSTAVDSGTPVTTDTRYQSTNATLTVRPHASLTLGWWGQLNDSLRASDERGETTSQDRDQRLSLLWSPRPWGNLEIVREERLVETTTTDGEFVEELARWSTFLRWTPGRNLSSTLEYSVVEQAVAERRNEQQRLFLHLFARFWRAIDLTLDVGEFRQESPDEGWAVATPSVSGSLRGRLTRTLRWDLTASVEENRLEGALPAGLEVRDRDERWSSELSWQPSGRFLAGVRLGRVTDGERSGVLQSYRLQWSPFPGGALRLSSLYDEEIDPIGDRDVRRVILSPSWRVNPKLTLGVSYLDLRARQGGDERRTRSVSSALSFVF